MFKFTANQEYTDDAIRILKSSTTAGRLILSDLNIDNPNYMLLAYARDITWNYGGALSHWVALPYTFGKDTTIHAEFRFRNQASTGGEQIQIYGIMYPAPTADRNVTIRIVAYKVEPFPTVPSSRQEVIDPLAGVDKNDYYAVAKALGIKD